MSIQCRNSSYCPPDLSKCKASELKTYFLDSWDLYEMLMRSIREERYFYQAPDLLRHPLIFYLGHTAAFYLNKLRLAGGIQTGVHERFETLFAIGVDPAGPGDLTKGIQWPSVEKVWAFRQKVKELVLAVISEAGDSDRLDQLGLHWAILMGIEHERIHFETSSVLIRQYPTEWLQAPASWPIAPATSPSPSPSGFMMVSISGEEVVLGKNESETSYGWDNEYGELKVAVASFKLSSCMVTNQEFKQFVLDGGYENELFWEKEGWKWKMENKTSQPYFWCGSNEADWAYRTMFEEVSMPLEWPVEVTAYEAMAYCKWKGQGYRLMTEAEWKLALQQVELPDNKHPTSHNLNLHFMSPSPVAMLDPHALIHDLQGNVWDWVSNDFYPLAGFKPHPWYQDFSEPYFGRAHGMMAGGSWASTGGSASKYYRLWFRRGFYQHAGFRLAKSN